MLQLISIMVATNWLCKFDRAIAMAGIGSVGMNPHKVGIAVGLFLGGWHFVWSLLVAFGWGQPLIDFVLWMHMIHVQYVVGPFQILPAALLVVLTSLSGYALGALFALAWNTAHRR